MQGRVCAVLEDFMSWLVVDKISLFNLCKFCFISCRLPLLKLPMFKCLCSEDYLRNLLSWLLISLYL